MCWKQHCVAWVVEYVNSVIAQLFVWLWSYFFCVCENTAYEGWTKKNMNVGSPCTLLIVKWKLNDAFKTLENAFTIVSVVSTSGSMPIVSFLDSLMHFAHKKMTKTTSKNRKLQSDLIGWWTLIISRNELSFYLLENILFARLSTSKKTRQFSISWHHQKRRQPWAKQ